MKEQTAFSDDQVIRSVLDGRVQNFELLIHRYKKKIVNFVHRMILDYDEAQSISQDVFLKVYESLSRYRMQENFQAFIFTIAKNLTLNYIKQKKRILSFSRFFSDGAPDSDRKFGYDAPQADVYEEDERERMITAALRKIKENQRLALILKVYLHLSYNRIAEITGWSVPKIETLISRAKTSLKNEINLQENRTKNV